MLAKKILLKFNDEEQMKVSRIKYLAPALLLMFSIRLYGQVGGSANFALQPLSMLGITSDSLLKAKSGGELTEIKSGNQKFTVINYTEDWFGISNVKAKYFVALKNIVQIGITLPSNIKRQNALKIISNYLGQPFGTHVAKKDTMPKFSAQWVVGSVSYGLNDFADSIVVFVTKSILYNYNVYYLPAGSYIIQKISADINGDAIKDEVALIGHRFDEKSSYYDKLSFITKDGKTKKESVVRFSKNYDSGYDPQISALSFTNKKYQEIFVSAPTGGSGGIINYFVYSLKDVKGNVLFSPDSVHILSINGKYEDGYKVSVSVNPSNKKYELDIADSKKELDELKVYDNGKYLNNAEMWINSYGLMETKDIDHDGLMELIGTQALKAKANYNTIALAKSIWKFKKGKFQLIGTDLQTTKN
jgi:hypothetical protein